MGLAGTGSLEVADLAVAQSVVAEGEDLPGDGDARDLAAVAFGDPFELLAQRSAAGGTCVAASTTAQRRIDDPWREMFPRRALLSELRTVGVSPAQAQRCRAVGNRRTSPISAMISIAV
jgi:hypothetical protein